MGSDFCQHDEVSVVGDREAELGMDGGDGEDSSIGMVGIADPTWVVVVIGEERMV